MAQQVALRCWAGRTGNRTVALHPLAHPEVHERDALAVGQRAAHGASDDRAAAADARPEIRDLHEPFGTLMLELPLRDAGFVLPTWDELTAVVAAARERDAVVHFDGARLWECAAHFGPAAAGDRGARRQRLRLLLQVAGRAVGGGAGRARSTSSRRRGLAAPVRRPALPAVAGGARRARRAGARTAAAARVRGAREGGRAARWHEGLPTAGCRGSGCTREVPHTHQFQVWLPYRRGGVDEAGCGRRRRRGRAVPPLVRRGGRPVSR